MVDIGINTDKQQAESKVVSSEAQEVNIEKYRKLQKLGMPVEQIKLKMKSEGLDPMLLDQSSAVRVFQVISELVPPEYAKFAKLKKLGMPVEQIKLKIQAEGLDPTIFDATEYAREDNQESGIINVKVDLDNTETSHLPEMKSQVGPEYDKYFKLLKMGMPVDNVKLKISSEGLNPAVLDMKGSMNICDTSNNQECPTMNASVQPELQKYVKLQKMGMPLEQVHIKMTVDGVDPCLLKSTLSDHVEIPAEHLKYTKLKKMGMPLEQIQMKMKADGVDSKFISSIAEISEDVTPEASLPSKSNVAPNIKMRG